MTATDTTITTAIPEAVTTAAKPATKAATTASAKAAIPAARKSAIAKLPAKAPSAPTAKKTAVAAKPKAKAMSKIPAKPAGKSIPAVQAILKPSAKPIPRTTPKASLKQAVDQKAEKMLKEKKPKLVRDSFTIPKAEYTVLDELKHRAGKLGTSIKKSELIRAGIKALAAMPDVMYLDALKVVPTVKTGRPPKK